MVEKDNDKEQTNGVKKGNVIVIKEGTVSMAYPESEKDDVFYNPVQVQNRDLSTLMVLLYGRSRDTGKKLRVLDAMAASGLRSLRYFRETEGVVGSVTINDLEEEAVALARSNLRRNGVDEAPSIEDEGVSVHRGDATTLLYDPAFYRQYDVIDLDPYGSAAPFLDGAIRGVADGGLLCVTCTDMAALGGSHPETCFGRYGAMPLQRSPYLQELALRILLQSVSRTAAVYGRTIRPLLSVGINFYIRVFLTVHDDKSGVSKASTQIGHVYQSLRCDTHYLVPIGYHNGRNYQSGRTASVGPRAGAEASSSPPTEEPSNGNGHDKRRKAKAKPLPPCYVAHPLPSPFQCPQTGAPFKIGGPLWLAPIHDPDMVQAALAYLETEYKQDNPDDKDTNATKDTCKSKKPVLSTWKQVHGLLTTVSEELLDVPLYYSLPALAHTLHCSQPPRSAVEAGLLNAGYRVSASHKEPNAVKTDAPPHVIWDVMRAWCVKHPVSAKRREKDAVVDTILKEESSVPINFSTDTEAVREATRKRRVAQRYPMNPQKHWGPKPRAKARGGATKRERTEDEAPGQDEGERAEAPPSKRAVVTVPHEGAQNETSGETHATEPSVGGSQ